MSAGHESLFCCPAMEDHATRECGEHRERLDCVDTVIHRYEGWTGIPIHDGGHSGIQISFCPWCGVKL